MFKKQKELERRILILETQVDLLIKIVGVQKSSNNDGGIDSFDEISRRMAKLENREDL